MEQLKQDITKLIKSMFDNSLEFMDKFDDFDAFLDYYDEFVRWRFNDGDCDLDVDDFASIYDFSYFDALKIIKQYHMDMEEHFDDYDDKDKVWNMVCFICANECSHEIVYDPKYKVYIKIKDL